MITKEKNRTKIICTVITAVLAAVTGGSVLRLYNVQNVTQTVNGNVIQILGETGISVSVNGGNVLMIKVIRTNSRYDSHAYICDTTLSVLQ